MNTNRRESAHALAPTDDVSDDLERKKEQTKTSFLKPCNDEQNIKFSLTQMAYRNQTLNIESSSLIESPVVSAVLISHGLLENGLHLFENSGVKIKTETKFTDESKIHQNQHRESSYKCQWLDCEQLCIDRDELAEHVNWNHIQQGSDAEYHCQWIGCKRQGKGFNARYKMLMHMRCHTNEKPHVCACGKRFARLENLKIHMRCHTGEKPYVCHVEGCGKAYTNSSDRFKHTRTHFVEKPYVCKVEGCSKRYTDPSSLRKHRKTCGHYQNNTEQNIHFETHKLESYSDKNSSEIKVDKSCTFLTGHQVSTSIFLGLSLLS
ncbi:uncharacterized protein LOC143239139 isoform X1 [Tachypleus tridentatus]|uniref:uncharacterized protein LOC143239139 isoform X1 n=2 Tax=Tachypleus tridentatus TaxID=6853 RepID=UPI003FCFCD6D